MKTYTGVVVRGNQKGKALGFPTVNIKSDDASVSGIYAARVILEGEAPHMAAAYADQARGILEAHILDFDDDVYGKEVRIEVFDKIRNAQRFESEDELKAAIEEDIAKVRDYFKN